MPEIGWWRLQWSLWFLSLLSLLSPFFCFFHRKSTMIGEFTDFFEVTFFLCVHWVPFQAHSRIRIKIPWLTERWVMNLELTPNAWKNQREEDPEVTTMQRSLKTCRRSKFHVTYFIVKMMVLHEECKYFLGCWWGCTKNIWEHTTNHIWLWFTSRSD